MYRLALAATAVATAAAATAEAATNPNVVLLVADDLGRNDLGYTNGEKTHTPLINAAVARGIELTSYYTYKVCSPTRSSLLRCV